MCAQALVYILRGCFPPSQHTLPSCSTAAKDLNEMSDEKTHMAGVQNTMERSV